MCNVLCLVPARFGGFLPLVLTGVSEMKRSGNLDGHELLFGGFELFVIGSTKGF